MPVEEFPPYTPVYAGSTWNRGSLQLVPTTTRNGWCGRKHASSAHLCQQSVNILWCVSEHLMLKGGQLKGIAY